MKKKYVLSSAMCVALALGGSFAIPSFAQSTTVIPESATPGISNFTDLGEASPDATLNVNFYMQLQNKNQLDQVLASHKKLTAAQFHSQFSPKGNDYHAVVNQLQNAGLIVNGTTDNNLVIDASGTVAQIESVLGTDIHQFQDSSGNTFLANTTDYHVTGPLANHLAGTSGVNQLATAKPMIKSTEGTDLTIGQGKPSNFFDGNNSAKIQQAYNFSPVYKSGLDGAGQTIAIVDAYGSPTIQSDLQTYNQKVEQGAFGADEPLNLEVMSPPPGQAKQPVNSSVAADWAGETSMDVELAHAVAPGAKILLVVTKDDGNSLFIAVNKLIDKELANQISLSWGMPEEYISTSQKHAVDQMFAQGAAEGINVFVSSGDDGDFSKQLGQTDVSFPASDPNVIAVGGTSLFTNSDNSYQNEFEWGATNRWAGGILQLPKNAFWMGTGGGVSNVFAKPSWQTGVQGLDSTISHRQLPDVAFNSDPFTGFSIVQNGVVKNGWGGTSDAAPQWAAICALANQGHMQKTGSPLPFINPLLYSMNTSTFHDVQHDNLSYFFWAPLFPGGNAKPWNVLMGADSSLQAGPGWDDATGLGTPDVSSVVNYLANAN
ncbi:kumamolisin [Paenibacillus sp. yr247]|uniref:S53 family peptidase n=1 Tax=Paenibacillus sp. yr247 TaxID=1761880 RepID=UPI000890B851|nr:S53 family peptidase [Paenibacillus sp. yr247]SDN05704.1 kumamolisin [Paenibacillus sp. yr247]